MCVIVPFILDVRFVDVPARVTQEKGHTRFLHPPSTVLALIFLARIQLFLFLVDRKILCPNDLIVLRMHLDLLSIPQLLYYSLGTVFTYGCYKYFTPASIAVYQSLWPVVI